MIKVRFLLQKDGNKIIYPIDTSLLKESRVFNDGYVYAYYLGDTLQAGLEQVPAFPWEIKPKLSIVFKDATTGSIINVIPKNTAFVVDVNVSIPISCQYIVPYFSKSDGRQKGAVLVSMTNGTGQVNLTIPVSGVYTIKLNEILDATAMKPIANELELDNDPVIAVIEN